MISLSVNFSKLPDIQTQSFDFKHTRDEKFITDNRKLAKILVTMQPVTQHWLTQVVVAASGIRVH